MHMRPHRDAHFYMQVSEGSGANLGSEWDMHTYTATHTPSIKGVEPDEGMDTKPHRDAHVCVQI